MKPNPDKFQILLRNTVCQRIDVCNESIENSRDNILDKILNLKHNTGERLDGEAALTV